MIKGPAFSFEQCLGPFTTMLIAGYVKRRFLGIYLPTFFAVYNFGNTLDMSFIFFKRMLKISITFQNLRKNLENYFYFWDNCILIGCVKLSLLKREYLSPAVNVLRNNFKIFHITKRDFFKLNQPGQWSMSMVKVPSFRVEQCFGPFTMLLVEGYCEAMIFTHLSNHAYRIP